MSWFAERRRIQRENERRLIAEALRDVPEGVPDPSRPPDGAWLNDDGMTTEIGATMRHTGHAVMMGILTLVAIGLGVAIAWAMWPEVARGFGIAPPLPDRPASAGFAIFMIVMTLPVPLSAILLAGVTWKAIVGRLRILIGPTEVEILAGARPLLRRRRLDRSRITRITEDARVVHSEQGRFIERFILIERDDGRPIRIGKHLSRDRLWWLCGVAARLLTPGS